MPSGHVVVDPRVQGTGHGIVVTDLPGHLLQHASQVAVLHLMRAFGEVLQVALVEVLGQILGGLVPFPVLR
jgi:hypothetical protein